MANRSGIYNTKEKKDVKPQYFVKEARYHPNGFTVYKVVCRVPDPNSFDCFKESTVWKRYSDFRDLYKCLATLHRKLYLNGRIPEFAKPKLFGRFDDSVVAERRQSAENVLNFATEHPPLWKSAVFKEFFQGLQPVDSTTEIRYLKQSPLKPNVKKERKSIESEDSAILPSNEPQSGLSGDDLQLFDPFVTTKEFIESTSTRQDETWIQQIKKNFPAGEESETSTDSYQPRELDPEDEAELLEALKITVSQGDLENYYQNQKTTAGLDIPGDKTDSNEYRIQGDEGHSQMIPGMDLEGLSLGENAREQHRKSSKASAYLEAVMRQNELEAGSSESSSQRKVQSDSKPPVKNGSHHLMDKPAFSGLTTRSSLLDLPKLFRDDSSDDESRGAYLVQAAQQVSFARAAEIKLSYEEAFGHYKAAINTLLQGVQGDTNEARIQAVRRKTANYLKRAEDIHSEHLKTTIDTNDIWKPDSKSSSPRPNVFYPTDLQRTRRDTSSPVPNIPSPRHNSKDLSCYKVLGTIGKVLLVLDTRNNETYVMKLLVKSCQNRIRKGVIPTNVPYMVRLHRYYSTERAVCLVIEHAAGGKLWDQLAPYFELAKAKSNLQNGKNILKVAKTLKGGACSTPKKSHFDSSRPGGLKGNEGEEPSRSFLDVCMEYETVDPENTRIAEREKKYAEIDNAEEIDSQPQSISDAIESSMDTEKRLPLIQSTSSSELQPVQRSWSYLSWDDTSALAVESASGPGDENDVFSSNEKDVADYADLGFESRTNFQKISSQGDLKLFTIDPDDQEDSIYDSRLNDGSEDENEDAESKSEFKHELLSEQDMSAVSLISDNTEKTLVPNITPQEPTLRSGSPSLSRIIGESKSSPCLSLNSSFEEERQRREEGKDSEIQGSTVTRVIDENGVSSVDAKSLFRTHSRTRSTASTSDYKTVEKPDLVKDVILDEEVIEEEVDGDDNNKIHSIFLGMDEAKKRSMSYRIPEYTVQRWAAEIVVAVGTLHSIAILCRDLNPNNILLSANGHIRLSYFGKWRQVERKPCDKWAVKHMYVAPEMSKVSEKKTEACDWWSVGAIVYELMTGTPLCVAHASGINSHTVLSLPDYLSTEAKSLLTGLLQYYPTQRLGYGIKGLDDLMDHPFFDNIEWDFIIEEFNGS